MGMITKVESAGQPQRDRVLDELWIDVTAHLGTGSDLDRLATALRWAQEGQVVRITVDGR